MRAKSCRNSSSLSTEKRGSPLPTKADSISAQSSAVKCRCAAGMMTFVSRFMCCHCAAENCSTTPANAANPPTGSASYIERGFELADESVPRVVLALKLVERVVVLVRADAELPEEVRLFLRVME